MKSLVELGKYLREVNYQFHCVTPETHARFLQKNISVSDPLRDLFGWSRAVPRAKVSSEVIDLLEQSGMLFSRDGEEVSSRIRFSTMNSFLFAHSAYPTEDADSVFFGPDTYRFVEFVRRNLNTERIVLDLGCGSGAGGNIAGASKLYLSDINSRALEFAAINARINNIEARLVLSDLFTDVPQDIETVIANPPFIADSLNRQYRDGGSTFGTELSVRIVKEAVEFLPKGGELILYTATCFVDGKDVLKEALSGTLASAHLASSYCEIDPDIFGSEIGGPGYEAAERIAAVGLIVRKK